MIVYNLESAPVCIRVVVEATTTTVTGTATVIVTVAVIVTATVIAAAGRSTNTARHSRVTGNQTIQHQHFCFKVVRKS